MADEETPEDTAVTRATSVTERMLALSADVFWLAKTYKQTGEALAVLAARAGGELRITRDEWAAANITGRMLWMGQPDGESDFLVRLQDRDPAAEVAALEKAGFPPPPTP